LLPGELAWSPAVVRRKPRLVQIVVAARQLLERDGYEALTMRRVAEELGIRAPSLYKHFPDKAALEAAIVEDALVEFGEVAHRAIHSSGPEAGLARLLEAYRGYSLCHPHLYRLATAGPLARESLSPGLEDWAGNPWYVVTGDASLAQALWSFAHGMVDLDRTWESGAGAFAVPAAVGQARLAAQSLVGVRPRVSGRRR
jgi:AcrR family transcriptional regulator